MEQNSEIWVETKTTEGKSYFYNARTRDTTWTKPEGPNIKVISQDQVEAMAQAATGMAPNTSTAAQAALAQANISNKPESKIIIFSCSQNISLIYLQVQKWRINRMQ